MINNIFIFAVAIFMVTKGATLATKYATRLAKSYHLSKYIVGFIIVAVISILPETFIAINSAISGVPELGLGILFGSNIADLTLVFAVVIFMAGRGLKIESRVLRSHEAYSFLLLLPLVLGLDGYLSRLEGLALIVIGGVFYYKAFRSNSRGDSVSESMEKKLENLIKLIASIIILLIGSYFVVLSTTEIAEVIGISPILIGMLVVGLGTTMPELMFSIESAMEREDSLAVGDILGTVLADATIVVGILAMINPFAFPKSIIYVTGVFMVIASFLLFHFMHSGKYLSKREATILVVFWAVSMLIEFAIGI